MKILRLPLLHFFLFFAPFYLFAQVKLTEIAPTNTGQITDSDNDRPDWIEIRNGGTQVANLEGWSLSNNNSKGWKLPETNIAPGGRLLVFASGKNKGAGGSSDVDHWETALYEGDQWHYFIGNTPAPADWKSIGFNAGSWPQGQGGFGYGDGDDATIVPNGTTSVYYRRTFTVADPAQLLAAVLSMDYDDGFVAYLNGQEIARSSNIAGTPTNTTLANPEREASGLPPEAYPIDKASLAALLVPGTNVLAVEIHNNLINSSDMSGRTWLHFGLAAANSLYGPIPTWFNSGTPTGGELHTDFKLSFSEKVTLYNPAGDIIDSVSIGYLQPGHSKMRINDDGAWCHTATPTPGATNGWDCFAGYAAAPGLALPAGFYTGAQSIALTGGGVIRYTADGAVPTASSTLYSNPIQVSATTVLRARRFDATLLPSAVATATYFIDDPTTLTAVSISLPPSDFSAVYDNYSRKGAVAVEYFDKNKQRQFVGDYAGYVVGNWSVAFAQKSMQFDVDEEFGSLSAIKYPIFAPDKPIESYHAFRIRNEDDDWTQARMRDRIVNELAAETHAARAAYRNVAAFINGEYWGHYAARERLDNYFVRDNYGADPDSVNMVKTHYGLGDYLPEYGTIDDFFAMSDFIENNDMSNSVNFKKASQLLDLENFTDYFETEIYVASTDWLQDYFNNLRLFKTKKNAPWKFLLWDVSYSSGNPLAGTTCTGCDVLSTTLSHDSRYGRMLRSLLDNPAYRRYFINRFADLMNTSFLPSRATGLINTNATEMAPEMDRHDQRWGTGNLSSWQNSVQVLRDFYNQRPLKQREHIVDNFQLVAEISITLEVNPPGAGTVKISTVVPKAMPWTGVYFHGNPVTVTAIANPGYTFSNWSANPNIANADSVSFTADVPGNTMFTANFTGVATTTSLKISEINYNSHTSRDAGDWFELRNESNAPIEISDFYIRDQDWYHRFEVPTGTLIPGNGNLVFAENLLKFKSEYPQVSNVLSVPIGFELSDKNDEIHVYDRNGVEAAHARYRDDGSWPVFADGFGLTLERKTSSTLPDQAESWFAGCVGGTPGEYYTACAESSLLSEINYNSAANADAGDWIELHNATSAPLDLSGWQLRDEIDAHNYVFPPGTVIGTNQPYHVFFQDAGKFSARFPNVGNKTGPIGFSFNGTSDLIRLFDPNGKLALIMRYSDTTPWPTEADGGGYTLEKPIANTLVHEPGNWIIGCLGGSPGKAYDPDCANVGTDDLRTAAETMQVWPNPAQTQLFIKLSGETDTQVQLRDVFGKIVAQQSTVNGQAIFQTAQLPRGLYFVTATIGQKPLAARLILD